MDKTKHVYIFLKQKYKKYIHVATKKGESKIYKKLEIRLIIVV